MLKTVVILLFLGVSIAQNTYIWPLPSEHTNGSVSLTVSTQLSFTSTGYSSPILDQAYTRYLSLIFGTSRTMDRFRSDREFLKSVVPLATLNAVNVNVSTNNETLQLGFDETYSIKIASDGSAALITAKTVYGALRGIETFSQLVVKVGSAFQLPYTPWTITDAPRFAWRGLMLDTSRWFLPVGDFQRQLDAASYAKINVIHWHITDAQSFPIQTKNYPLLATNGAYSAEEIYSQTDVSNLITYAKNRGIRLVPEFDTPGHTTAWGYGYPDVLLCMNWQPWDTYCYEPPCGQMDPTSDATYTLLQSVFTEMNGVFPDTYFHVGGDEVKYNCWDATPSVQQYKQKNGMSDADLVNMFVNRSAIIVKGNGKLMAYWEDIVTQLKLSVDPSSILMAWRGSSSVSTLAQKGYKTVAAPSDYYYLDCGEGDFVTGGVSWCDPYKTWEDIYDYEPTSGVNSNSQHLVIGGEVCAWSETINPSNIDPIVWPRTSAAAEHLWSPTGGKNSQSEITINRFNWHTQVLVSRGIRARPAQPEWCVLHPGNCIDSATYCAEHPQDCVH